MADGQRKRKLQVLQADDDDQESPCQTFVLRGEDHTLGNALRYIISKNNDVTFCGYTVPHPSEDKIHLRIQTNGIPATEVLRKGLQDLQAVCEHVMGTFQASVTEYVADEENDAMAD